MSVPRIAIVCSKCGGPGPFYKGRRRCKACECERNRAWRQANPDKARATSRKSSKAWLEANREKANKRSSEWQANNKERRRAYQRKWRADNPSLTRSIHLKRRIRELGAHGHSTEAQINARIAYYGNCCAYCGAAYEHLDHVIPLSRGGTNWPANLRPACQNCNQRKHTKRDW